MAALAIDVAGWYQKHHQAQVTADAAALAAANYMANGGSTGSATSMATTYASDNGIPIASSDVYINTTFATTTVTTATATITCPGVSACVTAATSGPISFAGISPPAVSAKAAATWGYQDCGGPGSHCAFIYGGDNVCPSPFAVTTVTDPFSSPSGGLVGHGITMRVGGASGQPQGGIISNSNLYTKQNGNGTWQAYGTYSNQANCTDSQGTGENADTVPPYLTMGTETPMTNWPIDYSKSYPACSGATCDTAGFPKYCTAAVESTATTDTIGTTVPSVADDVYCDAGTGTKSDPSTWNGAIVQGSALTATYIAGSVSISAPSNSTSGPASGTRLWIYAAESNATTAPTPAVQINSQGNGSIYGDVFVPSGTIAMTVNGTISAATVNGVQDGLFLEGWDVVFDSNGTVAAGGPTVNAQGQLTGSDLLTQ
jgi:hypothetical protein